MMTKWQKYCTHCGGEIEKSVHDRTNIRFHPMTGQKQFQRVWMRTCPNFKDLFSVHYGFEIEWKWIDVDEEEKE